MKEINNLLDLESQSNLVYLRFEPRELNDLVTVLLLIVRGKR